MKLKRFSNFRGKLTFGEQTVAIQIFMHKQGDFTPCACGLVLTHEQMKDAVKMEWIHNSEIT